jgi:type IV pilus assembly protein PilC
MPTYNYKAVDQKGMPANGQIDASNEIDLELRLDRIGLSLLTFKEAQKSAPALNSNKVGLQDLVMFCFQLEQLSSAGVPLLEGLSDVRESTANPYFHKIIGAVVSEVEGGKMLSQALAEHPRVFSDVFVSLVRAGEQTGKLPQVFDNLANTLKWQHELISQTKRLIAYPLFVLFVVILAVTFLMTYLVPQMVSFLGNMGQALPTQTKILIAISKIFVNFWWLLILLPIFFTLLVVIGLKRSARFRYQFDYLMLKMPVTGPILHKIIMSRFARYFALMYETGIPVLDAVKTCQDIVSNKVIADALERAYQQINAGDSMSESFRNAGLFPPLVVRMIKVGENTGALDKSLANIGYFYDRDVNESIEKMLKLIEPALTVLLGGILGFIMFSVLGPVYDSFSKLRF